MADRQPYDVEDDNGNHTTLLLSEEDAIARGLVDGKSAPEVSHSRVIVTDEPVELTEYEVPTSYGNTTLLLSEQDAKDRGLLGDEPADEAAPAKKAVRSPANKQRTATNK